MPSFGHGWRVETQMFFRRLCFRDGFLELGSIENILGEGESAGAAVPLSDSSGRLFFSYVCFGGHSVGWDLKIQYNSAAGPKTIDTDLHYPNRVIPSVGVWDGGIVAAGVAPGGQNAVETVLHMGEVGDYDASGFKPEKKVRLSKLAGTPAYLAQPRQSVEFGGEKLNVYWGDLHCHSNISPCSRHKMFHCTEVDEKHRFARNVGGMDFMALTDHESMGGFEWHETEKYAHLSDQSGSFVSFLAFEWTCSMQTAFQNLGHYNIIYKDSGELLRIAADGCHHIDQVWAKLKKGEALTIPHHPGDGDHPLDWGCEVFAAGTDDIERVVLVHKKGETELADLGGGQNRTVFRADAQILAECGYYYIRLTQKDGNIAWSSPIFVAV